MSPTTGMGVKVLYRRDRARWGKVYWKWKLWPLPVPDRQFGEFVGKVPKGRLEIQLAASAASGGTFIAGVSVLTHQS